MKINPGLSGRALIAIRADSKTAEAFQKFFKSLRWKMAENGERSRKKQRLSNDEDVTTSAEKLPSTLTSSISPPPLRRSKKVEAETSKPKVMKSPFQITWIQDLPESSNVDAVSLKDILGHPLIAECWEFNYLHDLDFLMEAFDNDVRAFVKVHVIHGFWKQEDVQRQRLKVCSFRVVLLVYTYC